MHELRQFAGDYIDNQHEEFVEQIPRLARANLKKIFTPSGSSRANKQQHNNMQVANTTMPMFTGYANWLQQMQPMITQGYGNLFNMGMQNNGNALANSIQQHALLNGLMANHAAMNLYGNHALAQGMGINAANSEMARGNVMAGQASDPATLMNHMAAALGYMQTPMQNMSSLASTIYGQPQVPVGPGPMDYLMQASGIAKNLGWQPGMYFNPPAT